MPLYDLLTREERIQRSVWPAILETKMSFAARESRYTASEYLGTLDNWSAGNTDVQAYLSVLSGHACPLGENGRRIPWSCSDCAFDLGDEVGCTLRERCKPCEQQRCAARTTANLTDAVSLLRRHGRRIRMLTLTLPSVTIPNGVQNVMETRLQLLREAKALLAKARRTSEWKKRVHGYLWNFECPVSFWGHFGDMVCRPPISQNRRGVPVVLNPHFHILLDGEYWPQADISDWAVRSGFGPVADIRLIRSERGARYALKRAVQYAAKEPSYGTPTRQTGGTIREASRLARWLYKNRTSGSVLDEEWQQLWVTAYQPAQDECQDTVFRMRHWASE